MHYSKEKPSCSTFRVITANFRVSEMLEFLRYAHMQRKFQLMLFKNLQLKSVKQWSDFRPFLDVFCFFLIFFASYLELVVYMMCMPGCRLESLTFSERGIGVY